MQLAAVYSFNGGKEEVSRRFPDLLVEVNAAIKSVNASQHKIKESEEKTMMGKILYDPTSLNKAFKKSFKDQQWKPVRVKCEYSTEH